MILIAVIGLFAVAAIWRWLRWPRVPKGRQYSDDELRAMSEQSQWRSLKSEELVLAELQRRGVE